VVTERILDERIKKLSLEDAWDFCLAQWEWIIETLLEHPDSDVYILKRAWLRTVTDRSIDAACFFCEYQRQRCVPIDEDNNYTKSHTCEGCPGRDVDENFNCVNSNYHHERYPFKFFLKLKELDTIRKCQEASYITSTFANTIRENIIQASASLEILRNEGTISDDTYNNITALLAEPIHLLDRCNSNSN